MNKFSRFYLSGTTHDNAVTLATVFGAGTSINTNLCVQDFRVPLLQTTSQIETDYITDLGNGLNEFSVCFYPFLLTNVAKNGKPFYFKHILKNGKYPYNLKLYDSTGEAVDSTKYYLLGEGPTLTLYHNLVNTADLYYYVEYVRVTPQGFVDYGFREVLNSTPVYQETRWDDLLTTNPNFYYVTVDEDDIVVKTQTADTYYIMYDNRQLIFFQADHQADQHWWLAVKNFAYKVPGTDKVYTTKDLYDYEEFYPAPGMNVVRERRTVSDVMFLSATPVVYTPVEFPILNVSYDRDLIQTGVAPDAPTWDIELPVRAVDRYSGALELDMDVMEEMLDSTIEVSYFVEQNYVVLDRLKTGLRGEWYHNFNPVFNPDIIGTYTLVYLRDNDNMDTIHMASFQNKSVNGVINFYLTDITPYDVNFVSYLNSMTLVDFLRLFDILENPTLDEAVLFLGAIILHNTDSNLGLFQKATDERQLGGGLKEATLDEVLEDYPETQYSWELQPLQGDVAPVMTSFLMIVPPEILTKIDKDDILTKVRKFSAASSYTTILTEENNELVLAE